MPSVLITGCSSGFGLEATLALAERGWRVVATMRNPDKRARLDQRVTAAGVGDRVDLVPLDVTDQSSVDQALKETLAITGGALDAVVNNAGVSSGGAFEDVPDEEFRRILDTNFFGVLAVTRAVLPVMREQRRGRIVIVSSDSAFYGAPAMSAYTASKWAIEGWAESLSYEVELFGIQVICVEPGAYVTDIWDTSPRFKPEGSAYAPLAEPIERFVQEKHIPHARDPREVGEAVAQALEARTPRFRYPVGPDAKAMAAARGVVPRKVLSFGLRKYLGLDKLEL